jgi:hypothetical protein
MAQRRPPEIEQARQLHRDLSEKVLEKAASDPQWKQRLIEEPDAALREADFPESRKLQEMGQRTSQSAEPGAEEGEVRGQNMGLDYNIGLGDYNVDYGGCAYKCTSYTLSGNFTQTTPAPKKGCLVTLNESIGGA